MGCALVEITSLEHAAPHEVEALLDAAFGVDRRTRAVYRVRAGLAWLPDLSFAAMDGADLVASLQSWPVRLAGDGASVTPLVLVGPVAVAPAMQGRGLGTALMRALIAAAKAADTPPLMMVGDPEYYARFGFSAGATRGWRLPGSFEARRLLARDAPDGRSGMLVGGW